MKFHTREFLIYILLQAILIDFFSTSKMNLSNLYFTSGVILIIKIEVSCNVHHSVRKDALWFEDRDGIVDIHLTT